MKRVGDMDLLKMAKENRSNTEGVGEGGSGGGGGAFRGRAFCGWSWLARVWRQVLQHLSRIASASSGALLLQNRLRGLHHASLFRLTQCATCCITSPERIECA